MTYRVLRIATRTVVEHGMRELPRQASRNLERRYTIHRADALIARACTNTALARHHAEKTRALVAEYALVAPFSAESGRRYVEASR